MPDEDKQWFELVKHNFIHLDRATSKVVDTVQGRGFAERMSEVLTDRLTPEEKEAGFAFYLRNGKRPPGAKKARKPPDRRPKRR